MKILQVSQATMITSLCSIKKKSSIVLNYSGDGDTFYNFPCFISITFRSDKLYLRDFHPKRIHAEYSTRINRGIYARLNLREYFEKRRRRRNETLTKESDIDRRPLLIRPPAAIFFLLCNEREKRKKKGRMIDRKPAFNNDRFDEPDSFCLLS